MEPQSGTILTVGNVGVRPMVKTDDFVGLASDSREVKPGYLFAALAGSREDGAAFVCDAVRRGAIAVLGAPDLRGATESLGVRFISDDNPRLRLAKIASHHFMGQPKTVAAVTGTNGKTSVTVFLRQIWTARGHKAASMGTIGVVAPLGEIKLAHTTPDPIELHRLLAELKDQGIEHLALEASSHGLDQYRMDGMRISAAAFTNITRDHLDYHPTFAHYLATKLRLFEQLLEPGGLAVVNVDAAESGAFVRAAKSRKAQLLTVGEQGTAIKLLSRTPRADGQILVIDHAGTMREIHLPLAGSFQASNALVAAALAIGLGDEPDAVFDALRQLKGAPGRMQRVAETASGAPIYIDYAHTPDALETVLNAIRPHVEGRLRVVFGCGGDRDKGKRALMGEIASRLADSVIVTDDNPRSEDARTIRKEILVACPSAIEIGDRADAIRRAVAALAAGDALIIAGKGHETGQIVGDHVRPFSDAQEAMDAALALGGRAAELHA